MRALLIALLFASSTANAAEWVEVGNSDGEDFKVFVDTASIVKSFPGKKAWFKLVFSTVQKGPKGVQFDESLQLMYFDCDDRKMSMSQVTIRKGGKVISTETDPTHLAKSEEIAPETNGEAMFDFVCKGRRADTEDPANAEAAPPPMPPMPPPPPPRVEGSRAMMTRPVNPDDYYPPGSIRRGEQGSPVVQACVGPNGRLLRDPVVTDTSGFPDLDDAAIKVAKATGYAAATEGGTAVPESCIKFKVKFVSKNN